MGSFMSFFMSSHDDHSSRPQKRGSRRPGKRVEEDPPAPLATKTRVMPQSSGEELNGPPPKYTEESLPKLVPIFLEVRKEAHKYEKFQIKGVFPPFQRRVIQIWVDDAHILPEETRSAIRTMAMLLVTLGKAFQATLLYILEATLTKRARRS
jgi:hypothetical protein